MPALTIQVANGSVIVATDRREIDASSFSFLQMPVLITLAANGSVTAAINVQVTNAFPFSGNNSCLGLRNTLNGWLTPANERLKTADGKEVEVWEFRHENDEAVLSAWAKHFRNHIALTAK